MIRLHNLGFPRIGPQRELKFALEKYWRGAHGLQQLLDTAAQLRAAHWQLQDQAGLDLIPVNDFSFYDHMLDHSLLLGAIPRRFGDLSTLHHCDAAFAVAQGRTAAGKPVAAGEMTKWFDTNYHFIVPEVRAGQHFSVCADKLFEEIRQAQLAGYDKIKPVLPGPLSWLWLAKPEEENFERLSLLDNLIVAYSDLLTRLAQMGVEWVQLDEPILVLDLPATWQQAFESAYTRLHSAPLKILLATYFGALQDNLHLACRLPTDALHVDSVRAGAELTAVVDQLPAYKNLSVGCIDGRNIWRVHLPDVLSQLQPLHQRLGSRLWLAPSCSLLHVPLDLRLETELDSELKSQMAFAHQKLEELAQLRSMLTGKDAKPPAANLVPVTFSSDAQVQARLRAVTPDMSRRSTPYEQRRGQQLSLPLFPTTTIGSFPQTVQIRQLRRQYRSGDLSETEYRRQMREHIRKVVAWQERLGLDVLVHGEPERNDMVEYFGEQLDGFAFTRFGWVQSYGSRCVKPPIIHADVRRNGPITVDWASYAQSLTAKPMKGMLTGPVTLLNWSFVRNDQPLATTCRQIALALRDEVLDLEAAGIAVIQIDEAALREGLPLRRSQWQDYLDWAVASFRLMASGVQDATQIHTHMCYSQFNDIMPAIAAMDVDVITIETSRSHMELLDAFEQFDYPAEIGPGVYDIHSPNIPRTEDMLALLEKALQFIPAQRLWVNPDCGLKTRSWEQVQAALQNMLDAAHQLRKKYINAAVA